MEERLMSSSIERRARKVSRTKLIKESYESSRKKKKLMFDIGSSFLSYYNLSTITV